MPLPAHTTQNSVPRTRREARLRVQVPSTRPPVQAGERRAPLVHANAVPSTAAADGDAFDAAVRALSSARPVSHVPAGRRGLAPTGASRAAASHAPVPAAEVAHTGPVRTVAAPGTAPNRATRRAMREAGRPRLSARRAAAASVSVGAVLAVGLLAVGMTLPAGTAAAPSAASALSTVAASEATGGGDAGIQAYVASGAPGAVTTGILDRADGFAASVVGSTTPASAPQTASAPLRASATTTVSGAAGAAAQQAGTAGILNFSNAVFTNNRACPVQWPFAVGVPISWGFGPRPGEFHEGVDFTPGAGAHIQAIAAGTVVVAQSDYYGYGDAVMIDHVIDGQKVASLYGHMETGSIQVHVGEQVQVGQYLGNTGSTGYAFGANTHFEIRQDDVTPINPIPWLQAHNQC